MERARRTPHGFVCIKVVSLDEPGHDRIQFRGNKYTDRNCRAYEAMQALRTYTLQLLLLGKGKWLSLRRDVVGLQAEIAVGPRRARNHAEVTKGNRRQRRKESLLRHGGESKVLTEEEKPSSRCEKKRGVPTAQNRPNRQTSDYLRIAAAPTITSLKST